MALRVFPVAGRSSFSDDFGAPRSGGRTHKGTDIFAPTGTPVLAADDGNARSALEGLGGQAVYLNTPSGHYYYAHLDSYEGTFPRKVRAGDVLGRVGTTGNAQGTSPHLHFEIHTASGETLNPFPELTAARLLSSTPAPAPASSASSASSKSMAGAVLAILVLFAISNTRSPRRALG